MRLKSLLISSVALGFLASVATAEPAPVSYYKDVRPIFVSNCNACHKPEKLKGDFDMTTLTAMLKGGKHGLDVVPGDPSKSRMMKEISGSEPEMPDEGDALKPAQVELIRSWIAAGALDDTPKVGEAKIEPPTYTVPPVVASMAFSPDGSLLAVTGYHEVLLHKSDGSAIVARLPGEAPRIESIVFSKDGKLLADCGGAPAEFGLVQLWNVPEKKLVKAYQVSGDSLYGISLASDNASVACGGADKIVHRINWADGKELLDFKAHADWVLGTIFTDDGKQLVSAGRDRQLKLIDLESGRFIDDINNPLEACLCIAKSPKAAEIAYGGDLGGVRIYKISDNQNRTSGRNDANLIRDFEKQPAPVTAIAFSPDATALAVGTMNDVNVYSTADGKKLYTLSGQRGPIYAITYKPDASQIAAAGYDGTIRLYDTKTGNLVKQFLSAPVTAKP
jgi:WD40 repeat protein